MRLRRHIILSAFLLCSIAGRGQSAGHMGKWLAVQGHFGVDVLTFNLDPSDLFPYSMSGGTVELFASKHLSFGFDITNTKLGFFDRSSFSYSVEGENYYFVSPPLDLSVTRLGGHARLYTTKAPAPIGFFVEMGLGQTRYKFVDEIIPNTRVVQPVEGTGQLLSITPSNRYTFLSGHFAAGYQWFFLDRFMLTTQVSTRFLPTAPRDIRPTSHATFLEGSVDQSVHRIGRFMVGIRFGYLIF